MATNISSLQQQANFLEQDDDVDIDEEDDEVRIPESSDQDTSAYCASPSGHNIQYQDKLETIPEDPQMEEK